VSCRVVSCRVVSCRVVSCRVVSCRVVSCRVVRWRFDVAVLSGCGGSPGGTCFWYPFLTFVGISTGLTACSSFLVAYFLPFAASGLPELQGSPCVSCVVSSAARRACSVFHVSCGTPAPIDSHLRTRCSFSERNQDALHLPSLELLRQGAVDQSPRPAPLLSILTMSTIFVIAPPTRHTAVPGSAVGRVGPHRGRHCRAVPPTGRLHRRYAVPGKAIALRAPGALRPQDIPNRQRKAQLCLGWRVRR
jgi:hypothetical protein